MTSKRNLFNWTIVTVAIILAPMILGVIFYSQLPMRIPNHFGVNNQPDRFINKNLALFGIPIIATLLQLVLVGAYQADAKRRSRPLRMSWVLFLITPIISTVIYLITLSFGLGNALDVRRIVTFVIAIFFIAMGNYFPTLTSEDHIAFKSKIGRKLGYAFVLAGLALLGSLFFNYVGSLLVMGIFIVYILGLVIHR
ncbi:DUF1648 domain-containing protein [Xylocopilactobacillus apicola]|uniref:DUF1648 domain-containing protein n=1 Tax=Xylocopilactobacillus apicola TaxID=2932184 RepID=A0AAU9DHF1_9LACO|nr:DUF1648 domain-containing protein [Xylocopilactobacillus apicola]BDR57721.1 hypothetical protein XA3_01620 [Xylocopilactobacillus apicola]